MAKCGYKYSPNSSGIFCRICHDGSGNGQDLISPCACTGSISYVHQECIEHWLAQRRTNKCELCGTNFICSKTVPTFKQYLEKNPRVLLTDGMLFSLLTPLATFATFLCIRGALLQINWSNYVEAFCLICLGSFLAGVFIAWSFLSVYTHWLGFVEWRNGNPIFKLILPISENMCNVEISMTDVDHQNSPIAEEEDVFVTGSASLTCSSSFTSMIKNPIDTPSVHNNSKSIRYRNSATFS